MIRVTIHHKFAIWDRISRVAILETDDIDKLGWMARNILEQGYHIRSDFHLISQYANDSTRCIIIDDVLDEIAIVPEDELFEELVINDSGFLTKT